MAMSIYAQPGDRIIFCNYHADCDPYDLQDADEMLEHEQIYTVESVSVNSNHIGYVYLEEVPGFAFNTVLFEDIDNMRW